MVFFIIHSRRTVCQKVRRNQNLGLVRRGNQKYQAQSRKPQNISHENDQPQVREVTPRNMQHMKKHSSTPFGGQRTQAVDAHKQSKECAFNAERAKPGAQYDHGHPSKSAYDSRNAFLHDDEEGIGNSHTQIPSKDEDEIEHSRDGVEKLGEED